MTEEHLGYMSYLLRLWQVRNAGRLIWRASLQSTRTGDRVGFADLESLIAFLLEETGRTQRKDEGESEEGGA